MENYTRTWNYQNSKQYPIECNYSINLFTPSKHNNSNAFTRSIPGITRQPGGSYALTVVRYRNNEGYSRKKRYC